MSDNAARARIGRIRAPNGPMASTPRLGCDGRILEGVVTTLDVDRRVRVSPMGPIVGVHFDLMVLRPFQTSATFANLRRDGCGVFHVVDDVMLIARSAIGQLASLPANRPASSVAGAILKDACRWFAFHVVDIDEMRERAEIVVEVVDSGEQRPFFGLNRAKHAVVEGAILATRVDLLPPAEIVEEFRRLHKLVQKTGAADELQAFALLSDYVMGKCGDVFGEDSLEATS